MSLKLRKCFLLRNKLTHLWSIYNRQGKNKDSLLKMWYWETRELCVKLEYSLTPYTKLKGLTVM